MADGSYHSFNNEENDSLNRKSSKPQTSDCRFRVVTITSFLIIVALVIFIAWQHFSFRAQQVCTEPQCVTTSAYILQKMNLTQDPCEDFFTYSCGGWLQNADIPPAKAKYGAFQEVEAKNKAVIKKLLDSPGQVYHGKNSSSVGKAKDYYKMCMDRQTVEDQGTGPVLVLIKELGSWSITSDPLSGSWDEQSWSFMDTLVRIHKLSMSPLFRMTVGADDMNSDRNILSFVQSGISLGEKTEYSNNQAEKMKEAFINYATKTGELLGGDNSTRTKMTQIYDFEKKLSEIFMDKEDLMDPVATYHNMTVQDFKNMIGDQLPIDTFINKMFRKTIPASEEILVYTPEYFKKLGDLLKATPKEVLANYLLWHVIQFLPGYLPEKFVDATLILTKAENGVSAISQRWERCIAKTTAAIPFVTGALYVEKMFSPESKKAVVDIIGDIKRSFMNNLITVSWMDDQTRDVAIDKVKAVVDMIGYPDYILNPDKLDEHYEKLEITKGQFLKSRLQVLIFQKNYNLEKLGKKPDKSEWGMSPSQVNAYYSPQSNTIAFPAGILQKPFYSPEFPLPFRYGSLGAVVGHELTHGFDNKGRNYDKHGNLHKWWTNKSENAFKEKASCLVDQYNGYSVEATHLNGKYTLGENIADNGGLKTAYSAYKLVEQSADEPVKLPGLGLTPEQLFYVGFAQIWCAYYTPQYAKEVVLTDVHSYTKFRVIGSASNSEDFSKAFQCPASSAMNPRHKCTVW